MLVECKAGSGSPTDIQLYRLQQWADAGVWTAVVWSLGGFKEFVEEVKNGGTPRYLEFYS